jgi:hypothetical protein
MPLKTQIPFFQSFGSNSRYTNDTQTARSFAFPSVIYRALRCDRCLVITFTAVTRVQIPSGTPNLFNGLEEPASFSPGTKRNKKAGHPVEMHGTKPVFPLILVGTKRHNRKDEPLSRFWKLRRASAE